MAALTVTLSLSLTLSSSFAYEQAALNKRHAVMDSGWSLSHAAWKEPELVIRDGWVQEGPASQKITAAYMVIENHGQADVALKGASSSAADVIELHKMELTDGLMKMRKIESINVPAGGKVELKPGGYHLMVIGLRQPLKEGDTVSMTLEFSNDLRQSIDIPVKPRSAMVKEVE